MIRTFIYGSCVSRDTFEFLKPRGFKLLDYVARQSLISAFTPVPPERMPAFDATSPFQRRMVEGDWSGSLLPLLEGRAGEVDLILWDLCDERLGVRAFEDGTFVTRSVDGLSSGLDRTLAADTEAVDFAEARHRAWWERSLTRFAETLRSLGLLERLVLVAPPWATHCGNGEPAPSSYHWTPAAGNLAFAPYVRSAQSRLGCPVVTLDESLVRCDPHHKWGCAPFHYTGATYERLVAGIMAALPPHCVARLPAPRTDH